MAYQYPKRRKAKAVGGDGGVGCAVPTRHAVRAGTGLQFVAVFSRHTRLALGAAERDHNLILAFACCIFGHDDVDPVGPLVVLKLVLLSIVAAGTKNDHVQVVQEQGGA